MKIRSHLLHHSRQSQRGIALISVLAMVVLLTALVVAFMLRAGNERQASGFYQAESGVRALADTAINIVQAQINEATTQGTSSSPIAWASQPGALRTFDNTGVLNKVYKLYSSPTITVANSGGSSSATSIFSEDVPPATWYQTPAVWVDLNAPVNVDPAPNSAGLGNPIYTHFPILDPRSPTDSTKNIAMDGFSITSPPQDTTSIDSNNLPNPAPMPVQWLYVLQDGHVIPPDSTPDGSGNYTFSNAPAQPTANNPIVGRIAYWTDDETCKVNINTAGADGVITTVDGKADPSAIAQGTFWSPPYFAAPDDTGPSTNLTAPGSGPFLAGFATAQPVSGEYQRYPGHPATVALSNILNTLGATVNTSTFYNASTTTPGVTPRYIYGGTEENTLTTFGTGAYASNMSIDMTSELTAGFRLYPTVSEMLFNPDRTHSALNTGDAATRQRMETGRFFLTAHSRASELNLFGLPRVCIWPLSSNTTNRTAVDTLIAFCTTLGSGISATSSATYYFTRTSSYDSTVDLAITRNQTLLKYLDYLTQQNIPGFGGNFKAKDYGHGLTGENDQIIAEIFDYIRTTNIVDANLGTTTYGLTNGWQGSPGWGLDQVVPSLFSSSGLGWNVQGYGSFPRLIEATIQFVAMGQGGNPNAISPTSPNATAVSPSEVAAGLTGAIGDSSMTMTYNYTGTGGLWVSPGVGQYVAPGTYSMSGTAQVLRGPPATGPYNQVYSTYNNQTGLYSGIAPDGTTPVQAFLVLTFLNPAQDWLWTQPYAWVTIKGLSNWTLNGHAMGFSDPDCMVFGSGQDWKGGGRSGYAPYNCDIQDKGLYRNGTSANNNPIDGNPFFSAIIPITSSTSGSTMAFGGGNLTIGIYDAPNGGGANPTTIATTGAPTGGHLIQTYTIPFPAANFPVPTLPQSGAGGLPYVTPTVTYNLPSITDATSNPTETMGPIIGIGDPSGEIVPATGTYNRWGQVQRYTPYCGADFIGTGDVLESMVLSQAWSDPRLLAVNTVPASAWTTHPNWGKATETFAHNLYWAMVLPLPGNGAYINTSVNPPLSAATYKNTPNVGSLAGNQVEPSPDGYNNYPWAPCVFGNNKQPTTVSGAPPDWDNGISIASDGPWINKADEGSAPYNAIPYYANPVGQPTALFSANREVCSPGMFGSLPTGVDPAGVAPAGWQTLLFRPGPGAAGYATVHPGEGVPVNSGVFSPPYTTPPDHLWMDLFWIPVSEPYAISEPLSTGGKINLNYQIEPFTYIKRATAIRAAMATEKIAQVSLAQGAEYKGNGGYEQGVALNGNYTGLPSTVNARYPIDLDATTSQFDAKFTSGDIFRSASQICEEFLVPMDIPNSLPNGTACGSTTGTYQTTAVPGGNYTSDAAGVANFAKDWYMPVATTTTNAPFAMVGDNLREQPYAHLYAKVTTKSNTYTVYYRVQSLKAGPAVPVGDWNESNSSVTGEYRGSTTLERFIDPNEVTTLGTSDIPDAAAQAAAGATPTSLESYYMWRVVENHQFTP